MNFLDLRNWIFLWRKTEINYSIIFAMKTSIEQAFTNKAFTLKTQLNSIIFL
jgi:hypothetical protein